MRRVMVLPLALILAPAVYGAGQKATRPVTPAVSVGVAAATTVSGLAVSPATISFSATDPDTAPSVAGNSSATVSWSITGGSPSNTQSLSVQAGGSTFTGCNTVPVSAVTVTCGTTSSTRGPVPTCSAAFTLSTAVQTLASGKEANGNASYTVVINYTLADSWKYVASPSCTLNLTYTLVAP